MLCHGPDTRTAPGIASAHQDLELTEESSFFSFFAEKSGKSGTYGTRNRQLNRTDIIGCGGEIKLRGSGLERELSETLALFSDS